MKPTGDHVHEPPADPAQHGRPDPAQEPGGPSRSSRRGPLVAVLAAGAVVVIAAGAALASRLGGDDHDASAPATSPSQTVASPRASASLMPATSQTPAAGICGRMTGAVVVVRIEPDTPDPRCASVSAAQSLRVVNSTGDYGRRARTITVAWGPGQPFKLQPGDSKTFPEHFGDYLAPGVHDLQVGPAYRAEIWLR